MRLRIRAQLRLKIQPQPPKFPFRDHPFEITVYLVDSADHLKSGYARSSTLAKRVHWTI